MSSIILLVEYQTNKVSTPNEIKSLYQRGLLNN